MVLAVQFIHHCQTPFGTGYDGVKVVRDPFTTPSLDAKTFDEVPFCNHKQQLKVS
jgi:hypothetical protein